MTRHTGAHPRIGATDVVPFVPVEDFSMDDCVALARRVGREIWERYQIPVYFYEAAATLPERIHLENVRRGQFEGLRAEVLNHPERSPDVGDSRLHPTAGATAVGARQFLVAYNINLKTNDVSIANRIAKAVRASSGGLKHVKAMGVYLESRDLAQVSMNITDFERMPLMHVFDAVREQAGQLGTEIAGSEIVGLVPRRALDAAAQAGLMLENFSPEMFLEERLALAQGSHAAA